MTPARMFFVAPALRTPCPAKVSAAIIEKADAAAEVAAINRDQELSDRRGPARQQGRAILLGLTAKTAPGEYSGRKQHQPRHERGEEARRRRQQDLTAPTAPPARLIANSAVNDNSGTPAAAARPV